MNFEEVLNPIVKVVNVETTICLSLESFKLPKHADLFHVISVQPADFPWMGVYTLKVVFKSRSLESITITQLIELEEKFKEFLSSSIEVLGIFIVPSVYSKPQISPSTNLRIIKNTLSYQEPLIWLYNTEYEETIKVRLDSLDSKQWANFVLLNCTGREPAEFSEELKEILGSIIHVFRRFKGKSNLNPEIWSYFGGFGTNIDGVELEVKCNTSRVFELSFQNKYFVRPYCCNDFVSQYLCYCVFKNFEVSEAIKYMLNIEKLHKRLDKASSLTRKLTI